MTAPVAVDWFRLLWDLMQRGHNLQTVSNATGIGRTTLRGYLQESQPPHWRGEELIRLWCAETGRHRDEINVGEICLKNRVAALRDAVKATDGALSELQQLTFGWPASAASDAVTHATEDRQPASIRFRVGVAKIDGSLRVFIVYADADAIAAERTSHFLRWCGEWQDVSE